MEPQETKYTDLITRYFSGEATPGEVEELSAWVGADPANRGTFNAFRDTWYTLEKLRVQENDDTEAAWEKVKAGMEPAAKPKKEEYPRFFLELSGKDRPAVFKWFYRIAAVVILLLVPSLLLYYSFFSPSTKHVTADRDVTMVTLPDGSTVTLNKGASLYFPEKFRGRARQVRFAGDAFFEVSRDASRPFILFSEDVKVTVLGTSFYVNTHTSRNSTEVILNSGKVGLQSVKDPSRKAELSPGEKAEIGKAGGGIETCMNQDPNYLAWKTQELQFNNMLLPEIVETLNRVYQADIRLAGHSLDQCRVTATFSQQSLESVLAVLKATLDLGIEFSGREIILTGQGCR